MIKPKFKDPVDELVDSIENLGIKTQDFLRVASLDNYHLAAEVIGLNTARSRLRSAVRKILNIPYPPVTKPKLLKKRKSK